MNRSQMCVANVKYKQPSANGERQTRNLLKYLTYRDSRDDYVPQKNGRERWVDHGLGGSVAEIAENCGDLQSDHVLMFSLVINPNPDLIAMVDRKQRERFVRELTEQTVENFFDARGIDTGVEYSYVTHHRMTDDPQSPGQHNPHTHVVLPGTYYDDGLGGRMPLYFSKNKSVDHIALLHQLTEVQMSEQMERYVGPDWEQRFDNLAAARQVQLDVANHPAHGLIAEDGGEWEFWCGTRQTDEQTSAAGYYRYVPINETDAELQFRPLIKGLSHEDAEQVAFLLRTEIDGDFVRLRQLAAEFNQMDSKDRERFLTQLRQQDFTRSGREPDFDIDF